MRSSPESYRSTPGFAAPHAQEHHERGRLLNRQADQHLRGGRRPEALERLGQAIDAELADGRFAEATALCRKLLRHFPDAVRAHCTLGILLLNRGFVREADAELERFVAASRQAGTERASIRRLRGVAGAVQGQAAREVLARHLAALGDDRAGELREWRPVPLPPALHQARVARLLCAGVRRGTGSVWTAPRQSAAGPLPIYTPYDPTRPVEARGGSWALQLCVAALAWALFAVWWVRVLQQVGVAAALVGMLQVGAGVLVVAAVTLFWIRHNQDRARRGRRGSTSRFLPLRAERDSLGRRIRLPPDGAAERAAWLEVRVVDGAKCYLLRDSLAREAG